MTGDAQNPTGKRVSRNEVGIIIVDHGSRRTESNAMLLDVVKLFGQLTSWSIIEPAHMEIAQPSIAEAFDRCVERGAKLIVAHPYFLLPGRHWHTDIPRLTAEAAAKHPSVDYLVTAPLGLHDLMARIMNERIEHCLRCAAGEDEPCDACAEEGGCRYHSSLGGFAVE